MDPPPTKGSLYSENVLGIDSISFLTALAFPPGYLKIDRISVYVQILHLSQDAQSSNLLTCKNINVWHADLGGTNV